MKIVFKTKHSSLHHDFPKWAICTGAFLEGQGRKLVPTTRQGGDSVEEFGEPCSKLLVIELIVELLLTYKAGFIKQTEACRFAVIKASKLVYF